MRMCGTRVSPETQLSIIVNSTLSIYYQLREPVKLSVTVPMTSCNECVAGKWYQMSRGSENFRKIAAVCDVERIKKGRG